MPDSTVIVGILSLGALYLVVVARGVKIALEAAEGAFDRPIVTEVAPLPAFYPAEDHHQDYYRNNRMQPYCVAVISPKMAKLRRRFLDKLATPA